MENVQKPDYGNWVSFKRIRQTFILFLIFAAAAALLSIPEKTVLLIVLEVLCGLIAVFFLLMCWYFLRARNLFAPEGGDVQRKILSLVTDHISWNGKGKALDIGCGSGALAVMIAKKYSDAHVTGTDYWGGPWSYGKEQCEHNASLEGVAERMNFVQASASKLPFEDGSYDLAVSNLVFHEVSDTKDKRLLVKEALRIVSPGGCFVFQDLFNVEAIYGKVDDLLALMKQWGASEVHYEDTSKSEFIPRALKLPFMVGTIGIIYGKK